MFVVLCTALSMAASPLSLSSDRASASNSCHTQAHRNQIQELNTENCVKKTAQPLSMSQVVSGANIVKLLRTSTRETTPIIRKGGAECWM